MFALSDESNRTKQQPQKKCNQMESVNHNGMTFPNEQALHEWRLIFEFDYFMEQAEQNLLTNQI